MKLNTISVFQIAYLSTKHQIFFVLDIQAIDKIDKISLCQ